jgi:Spy/CpxP family protein refolding chaperone
MTNRFLLPWAVLVFAGMLPGQAPPGAPSSPPPPPARGPRGGGPGFGLGPLSERRLTAQLGLTAEQQNKVHTAISEAGVLQQGMAQKEGAARTRLAAAVKAGNEAQIDSVSQEIAQLHQQRTAIHAKTVAKVYAALTADQKAKVDAELNRSLGVPQAGGPRPRRGGPGAPPPPPASTPQPPPPPQQQ